MQARQARKQGRDSYYLYCSEECAGKEGDAEVAFQPALSLAGMILVPDYEGQLCRVCRKKLEGPRLSSATTSRIPVAGG